MAPMKLFLSACIPFFIAVVTASPLVAEDTTWPSVETFEVDGHKAFLYAPPKPAPGKPWVWYAPTIKHVLIMKHRLYVDSLMKAGVGIAGVDLGEVRGAPASSAKFSKFYDEMVNRGWSPKPILLGQSRGGLMLLAWGMRNPDKVKAFAGIYPVCNLASWPLRFSKAETLADYGLMEEALRSRLAEFNPIENLAGLIAAKVPMFIVHGDADKTVPIEDNTGLLAERYRAGGGSIEVKVIPGRGHEVSPPFFQCQELVDFILAQTGQARLERLKSFRIRGVCGGEHDLERLATLGVNTVRGYSIPDPESMRATLDKAHRLGMKMVVSEWMPNQGENKGSGGSTWKFDYGARGEEMLEKFIAKVEAIGDHPAILMWGLGNEVHLDEPYLRVVNRMSRGIHKRFPNHLTSLTMVNAKPEAIAAVKKFAPDIDVLGVQSYSPGAVRGAIKSTEEHWGKPFYMSEFNGKGPWNFGKTPWGAALDESVTQKVQDLNACYDAIDASSLCLGSTIFVWGHTNEFRPTYFSLLLDPDPNGPRDKDSFAGLLITPQAEVMVERFTGKPPRGNRAPVLSRLEFAGGKREREVAPRESMEVVFVADDPNGDSVEVVSWILDSTSKKSKRVAGPFAATLLDKAAIPAPDAPGEYLLMVYAIDGKGGGSASTLPFRVIEKR